MRLCIHDINTRKFTKLLEPIFVESCTKDDFILYVYTTCGFYTLRFPTHEQLKNCVVSLRDHGYASTLGELYCTDPVIQDRERDYEYEEEMELTH